MAKVSYSFNDSKIELSKFKDYYKRLTIDMIESVSNENYYENIPEFGKVRDIEISNRDEIFITYSNDNFIDFYLSGISDKDFRKDN